MVEGLRRSGYAFVVASDRRYYILASLGALGLRLILLPASSRWGYTPDHDQFVRWAIQATDQGVLTVYDRPPPRRDMRAWSPEKNDWVIQQREGDEQCNYPPLAVYVLYAAGRAFRWVSPDRLINTTTAHALFSTPSILADFFLAWGCARLVARFKPGRAAWWAYTLVLLAPPFWWDSVIWGQMDSVLLAPAVWMVWAMVRRRWIAAGLLFGVAAALKPQAVLFLPLWALALATARPRWYPGLSLLVAGAMLAMLALPFAYHSGAAWWYASYVGNLFLAVPYTTLTAFNIWYVDLLICGSVIATDCRLGIPKAMWGEVFLLTALAAGFVWTLRRWRDDSRGYLLWAVLSLLAFVMLPIRVHERYILVVLPFLIVAALLYRRLLVAMVLLIVVATAQVTWPLWIHMPAGKWNDYLLPAAEEHYQRELAARSPEERQALPPFDEWVRPLGEMYIQKRAQSIELEVLATVLGLVAMVWIPVAVAGLKPEPGPPQPDAGLPEPASLSQAEGNR
jgi:Gpi18-like mannosyltransferase